jgi:ribonuclease P protein component
VSATAAPADRTATTGVGAVRSRRVFEELRRSGTRGRSGPLVISFLKQPSWSGVQVAYAVNRRVGSAVVRNRLKRRLRAIVSERVSSLPAGTYVVRAGPGGSLLGFDELRVAMNQAFERATSGRPRHSAVIGTPDRGGVR